MTVGQVHIGCAGWAIPRRHAPSFPVSGSHLERYAARFTAVEIDSSFYRPHRRATYERWAATVPDGFAFAVKAPRAITHECRLAGAAAPLAAFLAEAAGLGDRLGPLLFQLPPSLAFEPETARAFLDLLRARFAGNVVLEPRHPGWFAPPAGELLAAFRIARVAADPAVTAAAAEPGGWNGLAYFRLHGSPRAYHSEYPPDRLDRFAHMLVRAGRGGRPAWCILDNTASGAATADALALQERVGSIRTAGA